jgi:hypothetical protein
MGYDSHFDQSKAMPTTPILQLEVSEATVLAEKLISRRSTPRDLVAICAAEAAHSASRGAVADNLGFADALCADAEGNVISDMKAPVARVERTEIVKEVAGNSGRMVGFAAGARAAA